MVCYPVATITITLSMEHDHDCGFHFKNLRETSNEQEILEAITVKEYEVEYSGAYRVVVSPEKLAAFLAKNLHKETT